MNRIVPNEGGIIWVQGHEMVATNIRIVPGRGGEGPKVRFTGTCTTDKSNDQIRGGGYDGATYGWARMERPVTVDPASGETPEQAFSRIFRDVFGAAIMFRIISVTDEASVSGPG